MANIDFESEKLELDQLDKVVGGAGAGVIDGSEDTDETKKKTAAIDSLAEADTSKVVLGGFINPTKPPFDTGINGGATGGGIIMDPSKFPTVLADLTARMAGDIKYTVDRGGDPQTAVKSLDSMVEQYAFRFRVDLKVDTETSKALAWSAAYKGLYESGLSVGGAAASAAESMKSSVVSHVSDVARGIGAEVGVFGDLAGSLARSSTMIAHTLKDVSGAAAEQIKATATSAFEAGLEKAKETGIGKSVMAALDDPRNVAKWKEVMANGVWVVESPTWITPTKFLIDVMVSQAAAKAVGLSDFPSEMKQTAGAIINTLDRVEKAFIDIYASGYVAGMTFGLDVKGIVNIGQNMADMGKAIWAGDASALGESAKSLVTDMFNDMKDGLVSYYSTVPTKAFNWTKDITMGLLDDLGGTKYAEIAVRETGKAFTDFGNMARDGCVGAVNTIADFAKNDVAGAFNTVEALARDGVNGAINAVEGIAKDGLNAATSLIGELSRLGNSQAMESMSKLIVFGVPGALAEMTGAAKEVEHAAWVLRHAAERGSQAALNAVSDFAKDAGNQFQRIFVDGVQQAVIHEIPGAANKFADLVKSGVPWAEDSARALLDYGGQGANSVYSELRSAYGKVEGATEMVAWAAANLANDISRQAYSDLEKFAKGAGAVSDTAIKELGSIVQSGGRYANEAIDTLKGLAQHSETARDALKDAANAVGGAATTAYNEVEKALKSVWDAINPANWWPF